jgi:hypothetical protein
MEFSNVNLSGWIAASYPPQRPFGDDWPNPPGECTIPYRDDSCVKARQGKAPGNRLGFPEQDSSATANQSNQNNEIGNDCKLTCIIDQGRQQQTRPVLYCIAAPDMIVAIMRGS